jgi:phosphoethanolamine N-methyltransferase
MFAHIPLDGTTILDVGSGLGGVDCYLAQQWNTHIIGIEPEPFIIEEAQKRLKKIPSDRLRGSVCFCHTDGRSLKQFRDNTFDIVFSKEVLLHVPLAHKEAYLQEMYRVLKPGGMLIILDWIHQSPDYSAELQTMIAEDGIDYNCITLDEYLHHLCRATFTNIKYTDLTDQYAFFTAQDCAKIVHMQKHITEKFDDQIYHESLNGWKMQQHIFERHEIRVILFRAQKWHMHT